MIFQYHGKVDQPSEVKPRSGKMLRKEPPANRMISRIANRKPGIAKPMMITAEVQVSNFDPSCTALRMPSGIEIRYVNNVIQMPSDIETGNFSLINCRTLTSRK